MHVHILGICGTFMGGLAVLAKQLGMTVSGSDARVYPPMSTQLSAQGIALMEGYDPKNLEPAPDLVVIGNALSRGNPEVEAVIDRGLRYTSGAQWLADYVLPGRWVLAVAGTHGKTTTTSMLAWILESARLDPGFLIGGVPENFGVSARLGSSPFFVVEADEYDTAFFDKRSKFVHYRPRTAILNNLEFDHADIFPDLEAIKRQFHHLIRTIPASGRVIVNGSDENLAETLARGCWSEIERFDDSAGWSAQPRAADCSTFEVSWQGERQGEVRWGLLGEHNMHNALAAIAAARHAGVPAAAAISALAEFRNVRRRLENRGSARGVTVYDDFAHHPTAIALTIKALRARVGAARIVAVLEPRSNTMRMGVHRDVLADSLRGADQVVMFQPPDLRWDLPPVIASLGAKASVRDSVESIVGELAESLAPGDNVLVMSNGGFENIHARLLERLSGQAASPARA